LHSLVESWYRGDNSIQPADLERFLTHFHPDFTMVIPSGRKQGRQAFTKLLEASYGCKSEMDINIVDLELRHASPDIAIFTFEEQQRCDHHFQRRVSTAVFTPAPDGTPQWLHLQETAIDEQPLH
jgi:hypothetical protein